jgi:hypothetical protein
MLYYININEIPFVDFKTYYQITTKDGNTCSLWDPQ